MPLPIHHTPFAAEWTSAVLKTGKTPLSYLRDKIVYLFTQIQTRIRGTEELVSSAPEEISQLHNEPEELYEFVPPPRDPNLPSALKSKDQPKPSSPVTWRLEIATCDEYEPENQDPNA